MRKRGIAISASYFSVIGNAILAILKGVAGVLGNSYALIADAIESTTDIFSSILVLFGIKYSNKPADKNHPYGHGKAEPLITFFGCWIFNYFSNHHFLSRYYSFG